MVSVAKNCFFFVQKLMENIVMLNSLQTGSFSMFSSNSNSLYLKKWVLQLATLLNEVDQKENCTKIFQFWGFLFFSP